MIVAPFIALVAATSVTPPPVADVSVQDVAPAPQPDPSEPPEIVVTASKYGRSDPLRSVNAVSFDVTQHVDDAVVAPVARAYDHVTPRPLRTGLRNVINNLREPVVFANFLLQLKIGKAAETVGRFAINSTLGLAGAIDVARRCPFNLPWRPNGFADTLGVYGVKSGPFLFLPVIGPTTVRDLVGGAVDGVASPIAIGGPFRSRTYVIGSNIFRTLDRRTELDAELRDIREHDDPYAASRNRYLERRDQRIERLKGEAEPGTSEVREAPYGLTLALSPTGDRPCHHPAKRTASPSQHTGFAGTD